MQKIAVLLILVYNLLASNQLENSSSKNDNSFTNIEKKYIDSNTITLGMIGDNYPFSFKSEDKIDGFSYDYINLIVKKSGLKIKIEMDNWTHTLNKFKNGQLELIDLITYKKSREAFTNFTKPYFEIPSVIFAREGELDNYTGFESLKGKKVGINKDIYYHDDIEKLGFFEIVEFKTSSEKIKALAFEKVDVIFNNLITGQKIIKKGGFSNIKIIEEIDNKIIKKEDIRIGVKKEEIVLFSIVNKSIEAISREEKETLINKWFSAKVDKKDDKNTFNLTNTEKEYLKEKEQITMCIDPDWMPFEKIENGKYIGLASEYIKIAQNNIGIPIKLIKTLDWSESITKAKNRECDIFSMTPITKERIKYMDFTSPYLDIPMVITTKINEQFIDNIHEILDKKIGIVKNYSIANILKEKYPNIEIVYVKSINDGLRQVESGKIFAFIDNLATINFEIEKNFINTIKVSGRLDTRLKYRIATRNDEPILHDIFEKVIIDIDVNTKEDIFRKWIKPTKKENIINYTIIWYTLIFASILILFFLFRQYSLKKANKNLQIAVRNKTRDLEKLNEILEIKIKEEVSKKIEIQEKLFKSEKMAAMGEMIGNIAHQWRQPLSVISTGATGLILQKEYGLLTDEIFKKSCTDINKNAQYLSKTIDDFRNFIKGDRKKKSFKLSNQINSFINLVKGSIINYNINLILNDDKDINIYGYPNELVQCFINIINNSKDALEDNNIQNKYIFISTCIQEEQVVIKIKDNAGGIPNSCLPRIFEPYFTTKHQLKGTGLGLHMTYNLIVNGMNGAIEASNIEYEYEENNYIGAEFVISIPLS